MKILRTVDVDLRVGDGRSIRMQEEVEFEITGSEAVGAVVSDDTFPCSAALKIVVNNFAAFVKKVPDEEIAKLSPEARNLIAGFLNTAAKRFEG